MVEASPLRADATSGELGLHLSEPNLRVRGPERWKFDADSGHGGDWSRAFSTERVSSGSSGFGHLESTVLVVGVLVASGSPMWLFETELPTKMFTESAD